MDYKYKVGDKVRVRKDLTTGAEYPMQSGEKYGYDPGVNEAMETYRGQIMTIDRQICGVYMLCEDNHYWSWTDTMFETRKRLTCKSLL